MSIQSEINRISGNVANALTAIANKGVTIPAGSNSDDLATLIGQIQQGGGGTGAISIVDTPDSAGGTVRTITAVDISDTTAVASDVASGKYFYAADGTKTAGTASGGGSAVTVVETPDTGGGVVKNIVAVDISSDTVTAAHLESGYTAHDAAGNAITGTLSPSTTPAPQKQVNFIDYDGTILYSYTAQEANALSALPANPSHSGLTAQGWNWTLQEIKAQLTAMPDGPVWVGQMYITQSGDTEIDVRFADAARLSPILTIAVNGTVTVDWGDNTTASTVTGSSLTTRQAPSHTYATPGDYIIKIHVVSGSFTFYGSQNYLLLRKNETSNENRVYANCVQAIRLGSGITKIDAYAFYYCQSLASITIPSSVTSMGGSAFSGCYSLASITIPSGASIQGAAFANCYSLASVTIPGTATSIVTNSLYYCYSLASITIPSSVTSIGTYAFSYCYSLASVTIPSTVTSINNNAFDNCSGVAEYHIKPTTPPTLGSTVFRGIPSDCVIYVPSAKLNDYKTDTNWSAYASYMQGE